MPFWTSLTGLAWKPISFLIDRHHASVDNKVFDFLSRCAPGVDKTVEQISGEISESPEKVMASLRRLSDKHHVDVDEDGRWRKVAYGKVR